MKYNTIEDYYMQKRSFRTRKVVMLREMPVVVCAISDSLRGLNIHHSVQRDKKFNYG